MPSPSKTGALRGRPKATYKERSRISGERSASKLPRGLKLSTKWVVQQSVGHYHLPEYLHAYIDQASPRLDHNPFHLMQRNLIPTPVVQPGGAGRFMGRNLLRHFQPAAVLEVSRNAGGAKGMAPDLGFDAGRRGTPPDH